MSHSSASRIQEFIGDPVSDSPPVKREQLEEIFQDIQGDLRFDHELNGCLNCGICTATCPAAHYYDFSPREIVQLLWTENLEGIHDAMQEKIWSCAQCYTCAARCPFGKRSEEHTSVLQSHSENSYAVFCLKKKNRHMASTPGAREVSQKHWTSSMRSI